MGHRIRTTHVLDLTKVNNLLSGHVVIDLQTEVVKEVLLTDCEIRPHSNQDNFLRDSTTLTMDD
jgi:hypothetical protein